MKNKYILLIISVCLILLFTSCAKPGTKEIIKPFESIPIDLAKSIDFSNYTLTSDMKESGRIKTVTQKQDMEDMMKYIRTISCTESTRKIKDADYEIRLTDTTGSYIYSIGISKNQIYMHRGINSTTFVYDYSNAKVIKELVRVYKAMNYSEKLIMRK